MSFRGRGGRGTGRGTGRGGRFFEQGPPESVVPLGIYLHPCEADMVCKSTNEKIPFFNAPVYLENKTQVGKVDEILGPINQVVSEGIIASSFQANQKLFVAPDKLLPLARFLPKPTIVKVSKPKNSLSRGRSGRSRGGLRGRGNYRGGFAPPRGSSRGTVRGISRGGSRGRSRGGFRGA